MAIYHFEAKVISRGAGRSAVAAAAYMSCSQILNDYDGVQHDYTRKQGPVWQQVFLPEYAPAEWADRAVLWNAVEENEKTKDSRLAREFVAALPVELDRDEWIALLSDFIQRQFVTDGMCADVCIHDTDGHNPHAHIMLTVRPLDERGRWQYKTEKEYLCVKDGEERGFTAAEFKAARADGWEKQYPYMVDGKKVYMPPSKAEAHGYERVSKYPKSTKYGRQNPISARWNSDEQLNLWRAAWADAVNLCLERKGLDGRIDHRSHAERGLDEQPTIHEGVTARVLEKKGITSDRCELNRQIKADNALLRELKAQVKKLMQAVRATIPAMAEAMEKLRENMIVFRYQLRHISYGKGRLSRRLGTMRSALERYSGLVHQIKEKGKERKSLLAEKKATPKLRITRHRELSALITGLTEELEELRSQKAMLLRELSCRDDSEIGAVKKDVADMAASLSALGGQEKKCTAELADALKQYAELKEQAVDLDPDELLAARLALRPEREHAAASRLQTAYGDEFKAVTLHDSKLDVRNMLSERVQRPRKTVNRQQKRKAEHREQER